MDETRLPSSDPRYLVGPYVLRARTILPMADETAVADKRLIARRIRAIDNGALRIEGGRISDIGTAREVVVPPACPVFDLGEVCLIPGVLNCHAHIDLSALAGKTIWGAGFSTWLKSLIALRPRSHWDESFRTQIAEAVRNMVAHGTSAVGNICTPGHAIEGIETEAKKYGLTVYHLAEAFGFQDSTANADVPTYAVEHIARAGHALYSTSPLVLTAISNSSCAGSPFSLHLAESEDECAMLEQGTGPLYDIMAAHVLPKNWTVPHLRPVAYAHALNLLSPQLLAVHCVHVSPKEAALLGENHVRICLCPRSNHNLGVGEAPVSTFIEKNILLVLGTDGYTSNTDLTVLNDARFLLETQDLPKELLIRMLTVNAAAVLNLPNHGRLVRGAHPAVAILPNELLPNTGAYAIP